MALEFLVGENNYKNSCPFFCAKMKQENEVVNGNMELDKNGNLGIGQFLPILFSLNDKNNKCRNKK